jgi:hypothetical protein
MGPVMTLTVTDILESLVALCFLAFVSTVGWALMLTCVRLAVQTYAWALT